MSSTTPLPVGVGYGVVVGIGFFFAAVMCGISYIQVGLIPTERGVGIILSSQNIESIHKILHQDKRGVQHCQ